MEDADGRADDLDDLMSSISLSLYSGLIAGLILTNSGTRKGAAALITGL